LAPASNGEVDVVVGVGDVAPGRVLALADPAEAAHGGVNRVREAAAVALEREMGGLELERRAELEQARDGGLVEAGDLGAAVRLDRDEPVRGERPKGRPDGVPCLLPAIGSPSVT